MHALAKEYKTLALEEVLVLLRSEVHEDRLLALLILVWQSLKADDVLKKQIYQLYLGNTRFVNNWDLVDCSAPEIVGGYLADKSRRPLDRLSASKLIWARRISIIATGYFIRQGHFDDTLRIAELLLGDRQDLIYKATGWMLREVGKRNESLLEDFLMQHAPVMPRTMLRYAIERFPQEKRKAFLKGPELRPEP
jgi:3-methyladenine DNA glycosylase AlkD